MKALVIKGKDRLWPKVTWEGTSLILYYLGADDEDVSIRETNEIDFDEFFLHLDRGGSIFVTVRPPQHNHLETRPTDDTNFRRILRGMLPDFMEKFPK
jgi:hypothetical protein